MPAYRKHRPRYLEFEDQVSAALQDVVKLKGITHSGVSRLTGMAQGNVSVMLSKKGKVHWSTLLEMMPIFGVQVEVVLRDAQDGRSDFSLSAQVQSDVHPDMIRDEFRPVQDEKGSEAGAPEPFEVVAEASLNRPT